MNSYIALLRGINVSGQKKIKMADLRAHLSELPMSDIQTYIQSGNIVFDSEIDTKTRLEQMIQEKIFEKYQFEVPTLIIDATILDYVLTHNPFVKDPEKDPKRFYVTFLSDIPETLQVEKLDPERYLPEEFALDHNIIFFYSPSGYGRAKMNNNFFEQQLKVQATTRNWRTIHKLREMTG